FQTGWVNPHALMIGGNIAAHQGDRREALRYFDAAIEKSDWLGHRQEVRTVMSLAAVLLADEDPEASAVLFGAGDAPAPDYAHTPRTVEARERAVAMLEKTLGKSQYAELYARGKAMNDFDAGRYVRAAISRVLAAPQ